MKQQYLKNFLAAISLTMTASFAWGLAPGFAGFLIAAALTGVQASAMLYMPSKLKDAISAENGLGITVYGLTIVSALLLSVVASVATLSAGDSDGSALRQKRASLQQRIDVFIEHDRVTQAGQLQEQLDSLPVPSVTPLQEFGGRVQTVTGIEGNTVINTVIVGIGLLLDLTVLLMGVNLVPSPELQNRSLSGAGVQPEQVNQEAEAIRQVPPSPEVLAVFQAISDGVIHAPTVRSVRELLKCSQRQAQLVAANCRQIEKQLPLI
ncbi:hypothetical protein [Endozoicomonas euniceicola]|uniref:MotA/TolQ/ExbB proton channel domain-containing protein n=1 Tax=Endozoicomonas euniceicola TaxID=1234143 RepID=A0ABY6GPP6_9GAMM|nr:hypothetical protein [Endozoicomonas euniceicola]UYM14041.1 hypothetical protein NX720_14090 [Endozoicomonas euniceicola]